ncbi:MAG TPA: hypothetical protein VJM32_02620 [Candidatus Saccharimonadales bacterium]|nr:hypothetical protein [Candidatus Saccharimonadales bacterium]
MNEEIFGDLAIEQASKDRFGVSFAISEVIVRGIQTGVASQATIFKTTNGQMWLFIASQSPLLLDDVQKIVARMNLEAELFCPPHGETDYFSRIGRDKFKGMFPGKPIVSDDDLRYYRKLAPYNPALIRLGKIKGEIRGYNSQSKAWHKVKDYNYSKIKTI